VLHSLHQDWDLRVAIVRQDALLLSEQDPLADVRYGLDSFEACGVSSNLVDVVLLINGVVLVPVVWTVVLISCNRVLSLNVL
jgi:repressor of nif and glnA expression